MVLGGILAMRLFAANSAEVIATEPPAASLRPLPDSPLSDGAAASSPDSSASPPPVSEGHGISDRGDDTAASENAPCVIYLTGHVQEPGLVELTEGARVGDAIEAAGGFTPRADVASVNLARPVTDGEHLHVRAPGESAPPSAGRTRETTDVESEEPINVNTADSSRLQELPGIGPALAARIIEHRKANGPFTSVDQLDDVSGIGSALLSRLRDHVRVS